MTKNLQAKTEATADKKDIMIKCNAKISGTISRRAVRRKINGEESTIFALDVLLPAPAGAHREKREVRVAVGGASEPSQYRIGSRCDCIGQLSIRKIGSETSLMLKAASVDMLVPSSKDSITGYMSFLGAVGRNIEARKDRKGNPMLVFSGYSAEKAEGGYEYIWVRFVAFGMEQEPWLVPQAKIEAYGKMEMSSASGSLRISCVLRKFSLCASKDPIENQ